LKFGFARIPKTYRRLTTDNILAAKAIFWVKGPNRWKSSLARSVFKVQSFGMTTLI
jgi:hypothetical protein